MAFKLAFITLLCLVASCLGLGGLRALQRGTPANDLVSRPFGDGSDIMTSLAAFDSNGLSDSELEDMASAAERLVTKGDDAPSPVQIAAVKSIDDFISKIMIPNRELSQKQDQLELQKRMKAVESCHLDQKFLDDMNVAEDVGRAKGLRSDYEESNIRHGNCLEMLESHKLLVKAYCYVAGAQNITEFCQQSKADNEKCCSAHANMEEQAGKCEGNLNEAQYAEKQHKVIMEQVCADYDTCYETNLKAYDGVEKVVKTHEKTRSWKELLRLKCLVSDFKDGKVSKEQAKACGNKDGASKKIKYPEVPAKAKCVATVSTKVAEPP